MVTSILIFFDESEAPPTAREQLQFLISILDMRAFPANELTRIALCDEDMSFATLMTGG